MSAILDTSFLFALADLSDRNHGRVLTVAQTLTDQLILPIPVLPEVCYLIASRLGHTAMRRFVQELTTSNIILESITVVDLQRVSQILNQYADSKLDFVDATLVTIAERQGIDLQKSLVPSWLLRMWYKTFLGNYITRILSLDRRDYSIIRPRHCPYFEILP